MNILHITTFLQGGAGRIIAELATSQALSGHKVTVAASGTGAQDYGNYPEFLDQLRSAGVHVVLVESTFKRDLALNIAAFGQIMNSLDAGMLSLIHTHAAIPSMIALLLRSSVKRSFPVVQTMHGWGIKKSTEQAETDITLMNQLDAVVTPSDSSRQLLIRLGVSSKQIRVVPNGISVQLLHKEHSRISLLEQWRSQGLKILVCIGTIGPRKNQRLLLKAMSDPGSPRDLACAFVGEGDEVSELRTMTQENGLSERVHFFGYQPEGAKFVENADWLVLPSNDEGLPISILEAYRAGVPVLGSNISEIAEVIIPDRTGILFEAGNAGSLVLALRKVASMPETNRSRMGSASKALWQEYYTLEKMLDRYIAIYKEFL